MRGKHTLAFTGMKSVEAWREKYPSIEWEDIDSEMVDSVDMFKESNYEWVQRSITTIGERNELRIDLTYYKKLVWLFSIAGLIIGFSLGTLT